MKLYFVRVYDWDGYADIETDVKESDQTSLNSWIWACSNMEKTLEFAPSAALFFAFLGACRNQTFRKIFPKNLLLNFSNKNCFKVRFIPINQFKPSMNQLRTQTQWLCLQRRLKAGHLSTREKRVCSVIIWRNFIYWLILLIFHRCFITVFWITQF